MVTSTQRSRSPLQSELDGMTKVFGSVAWLAVGVIAIFGIARGQALDTVLLLCISTAIASIPTGLPTFVQAMLSSGAQRLAEAKAVVKSLADVETLGGTTVINSDKTGTLTLNADDRDDDAGRRRLVPDRGRRLSARPARSSAWPAPSCPTSAALALGLTLCSDATVADDETIIGDPTEAALVVLAAKMSADAESTRSALRGAPRCRSTPSTSSWRPSTTAPTGCRRALLKEPHFMTVKGAPDVVLGLCSHALWHGRQVPIDDVRKEILAANRQLSERGLRVLAFAARDLDDAGDGRRDQRSDGGGARPAAGRARRHHRPAAHRGERCRPHGARRPASTCA